jgi:hypothetical protein
MQNCLFSYRVSSFERVRAAKVFSSNRGTDRFQLADFDVLLVVLDFRRVIVHVFDEDCDLFSNCGITRSFSGCILFDGSKMYKKLVALLAGVNPLELDKRG